MNGVKIEQNGDLVHLSHSTPTNESEWNQFKLQCRGIVMHVVDEYCLYFGPVHSFEAPTPGEFDAFVIEHRVCDSFSNKILSAMNVIDFILVGVATRQTNETSTFLLKF